MKTTKNDLLQLIQQKIPGHRKGQSNVPNWIHSMRVYDLLKAYGYDDTTCTIGCLHDIIEDGGMTRGDLIDMDFSSEIAHTVALVSHDKAIQDKRERWMNMLKRIDAFGSKRAWAVKVADIIDNIRDSDTLSSDSAWFMLHVKRPVILMLSKKYLENDAMWKDLYSMNV